MMKSLIHQSNKDKRRFYYGSVGCLICLLILLAAFFLFVNYDRNSIQRSPSGVAANFVHALSNNDYEEAKSITSTDRLDELEMWIDNHEKINCTFSLMSIGDGEIYGVPSENYKSSSLVESHDYYIIDRYGDEGWYSFSIEDIVVEYKNAGWVVVDWRKIEEQLEVSTVIIVDEEWP